MPFQGGMKGCMVPGDAHPYLAPYKRITIKKSRLLGFFRLYKKIVSIYNTIGG